MDRRPAAVERTRASATQLNRREFLSSTLASAAFLANATSPKESSAGPLRLHPANSHYFLWRGKPTVLITATEHYGAVLNGDFNYARYFQELKAHGFNLTRLFSGSYRERPGWFNIAGNTLGPAEDKFICPWARNGDKFDLKKWDAAYFERLKDFIAKASDAGVVVELVLFCTMYGDEFWDASPMNVRNNVNGIGDLAKNKIYGAATGPLFDAQSRMVRKLVTELNAFDNLYYEVCNEPYERSGITKEWNDTIVAAIVDSEANLPKKHLIAQNFSPSNSAISDLNPHVSILNFHAAKPEVARANYHLNRVLAFDETGGSDQSDRKYRTEGWDWIMAGGAVYDHLDFSFTTDRPDGSAAPLAPGTPGGGGPELRRQLRVMKQFIESFDFVRMAPANAIIKDQKIVGTGNAHVLAEEGQAYLIYINGGTQAELMLELPTGKYKAEWLNTRTGAIAKVDFLRDAEEKYAVSSPNYSEDIAVRVKRQ